MDYMTLLDIAPEYQLTCPACGPVSDTAADIIDIERVEGRDLFRFECLLCAETAESFIDLN